MLQPLAVWLVFRIVREHVAWRPAAWLGRRALPRPVGHPPLQRRPPARLRAADRAPRRSCSSCAGTSWPRPSSRRSACSSTPRRGSRRSASSCSPRSTSAALAALDLGGRRWPASAWSASGAAGVLARLTTGYAEVITAAEAHHFPEFGEHGQMHFFVSSTIEYLKPELQRLLPAGLGLDPRRLGAAPARRAPAEREAPSLGDLVHGDRGPRPLRRSPSLLFRLYLPAPLHVSAPALLLHRRSRCGPPDVRGVAGAGARLASSPCRSVLLVAVGLALTVFPLGPQDLARHSAPGSWTRRRTLAVGLAVGALVAVVLCAARPRTARERDRRARRRRDGRRGASARRRRRVRAAGEQPRGRRLHGTAGSTARSARVPKDAIVAADPFESNCIPIAARRPVVISRKLYQPWAARLLRADPRAHVPDGRCLLRAVRRRRRRAPRALRRRLPGRPGRRRRRAAWFAHAALHRRGRAAPANGRRPAIENLPEDCLAWSEGRLELYSLACVAGEES